MKLVKNQNGFSVVELLLGILIVAVLGFAGYYVWNENQNQNSNETDTSQTASTGEQENNATISTDKYTSQDLNISKTDEGTYNNGEETFKHVLTLAEIVQSADGKNIGFALKWENQGTQQHMYSASDCTLTTASKKIIQNSYATEGDNNWYETELASGGSVETVIFFAASGDELESGTVKCAPEGNVWGAVEFTFKEA